MNTKLAEFLRYAAGRRFQYGSWDCGLWLGAWVALARDCADPAAHHRGAYHDADGAQQRCGRFGLLREAGRCFRAAGLARTTDPLPGDIGIITVTADCIGPRGGIRVPRGWVVLHANGGLTKVPDEFASSFRVLSAWRV